MEQIEFYQSFIFIVIGCGGIGGSVASELPKFIMNSRHKMLIIDGDIVEEKNCKRQPYQNQHIGLNKARALAKKINSFYNIDCLFYDKYLTDCELDILAKKYHEYIPIFVGCVDNDATRKLIEQTYNKQDRSILIDGANSEYEGNVYVSYKKDNVLRGPIRGQVYDLSNDINPGLKGCEQQIAEGAIQFLITNRKVATVMLEHIHAILTNQIKVGVSVVKRFETIHY